MNIRSALFLGSAPAFADCPASESPEFALIGRSNVGKSSLVNMLTRSKALAKVSAVPGKTQLINFFGINQQWTLVDLPGYGYAKVAKSQREGFGVLISEYLQQRTNLALTLVLIDSRLTPQQIDLDFLQWMTESGLPFGLVFTKTDKLSRTAVQRNVDGFLARVREFTTEERPMLWSSAQTGTGRLEILKLIGELLEAGV